MQGVSVSRGPLGPFFYVPGQASAVGADGPGPAAAAFAAAFPVVWLFDALLTALFCLT